jgi:branched-chain amino acid transport system ATP-binding protein
VLELKELSVSYGPISALRNVTLKVEKGETVALIGANGAGKTTTLRTISGLLKQSHGTVTFDGQDLSKLKPHEIVRLGVCHVPERRGIFANLTVLENLKMGGYIRHPTTSDYDEVFTLFPRIKERLQQVAGTLSGGEQQMLAISRALLAKPRLLLLDEPSLGLAPQITKAILETVKRINQAGVTVMLVEQNARAALTISKRGYVLEVGEVVFSDASETLLSNDVVRKAYLGEH